MDIKKTTKMKQKNREKERRTWTWCRYWKKQTARTPIILLETWQNYRASVALFEALLWTVICDWAAWRWRTVEDSEVKIQGKKTKKLTMVDLSTAVVQLMSSLVGWLADGIVHWQVDLVVNDDETFSRFCLALDSTKSSLTPNLSFLCLTFIKKMKLYPFS